MFRSTTNEDYLVGRAKANPATKGFFEEFRDPQKEFFRSAEEEIKNLTPQPGRMFINNSGKKAIVVNLNRNTCTCTLTLTKHRCLHIVSAYILEARIKDQIQSLVNLFSHMRDKSTGDLRLQVSHYYDTRTHIIKKYFCAGQYIELSPEEQFRFTVEMAEQALSEAKLSLSGRTEKGANFTHTWRLIPAIVDTEKNTPVTTGSQFLKMAHQGYAEEAAHKAKLRAMNPW